MHDKVFERVLKTTNEHTVAVYVNDMILFSSSIFLVFSFVLIRNFRLQLILFFLSSFYYCNWPEIPTIMVSPGTTLIKNDSYIYIYINIYIYIYTYIYNIYIFIYIYIQTTKCKERNYGCRYSELHVTHASIFSLLIITLCSGGTIQQKGITNYMTSFGVLAFYVTFINLKTLKQKLNKTLKPSNLRTRV